MIFPVMPAKIDPETVMPQILELIATTPKSLNSICAENKHFPHPATVYRWIDSRPDLCERYARAKEAQLQILADELIELADRDRVCQKRTIKADGTEEIVILDQVERTKLQIDTRKWLLAKLNPKKYGDRLEHTGEIGIKTILLPATHREALPGPDREPEFLEGE